MLRPIFSRRRALLGELCHIVERLLIRAYSGAGVEGRPGLILFVQTFGDPVANENTCVTLDYNIPGQARSPWRVCCASR